MDCQCSLCTELMDAFSGELPKESEDQRRKRSGTDNCTRKPLDSDLPVLPRVRPSTSEHDDDFWSRTLDET